MWLLAYAALMVTGAVTVTAVLNVRHKKHVREYMADGMTEEEAEKVLLQEEFSML